MTKFIAEELSLDQVSLVRPLLARIVRVDKSLGDQLRRSLSSVTLNLSEGNGRVGADRVHMFRTAYASNREVKSSLRLAVRYGYVADADIAPILRHNHHLGGFIHGLMTK